MFLHQEKYNMEIEVVAAIIFYKKKILATQRKFSKNNDISLKYEFPGGKIKKNENKENALKRELYEELNLKVSKLKSFFSNSFKYKDVSVNLYFYTCTLKNLLIKLNVHESYKLLSVKDLRSVEWLAADYLVISKLEKEYKVTN